MRCCRQATPLSSSLKAGAGGALLVTSRCPLISYCLCCHAVVSFILLKAACALPAANTLCFATLPPALQPRRARQPSQAGHAAHGGGCHGSGQCHTGGCDSHAPALDFAQPLPLLALLQPPCLLVQCIGAPLRSAAQARMSHISACPRQHPPRVSLPCAARLRGADGDELRCCD